MKTQALSTALLSGLLLLAQASCGGARTGESGDTPGQTHSTAIGDGEIGLEGGGDDVETPLTSTAEPAADAGVTAPAAPVTFVLTNSGTDNLYINMDKGWQAVIYAYSGQPPNAKPMVMFAPHCTASCDAAAEDLCPVCEAPQRVKEIKAAENHDELEPGQSREVSWNLEAFTSKRTKKGKRDGRRVSCNCFNTAEPTPATYTIKACALRKTQSAKSRSLYQCAESTLTLPVTEPVKVELDFGNP